MNKIFRALVPVLSLVLAFGVYAPTVDASISSVTLSSPTGGEHWSGTHNITWTTGSTPPIGADTIDIIYSNDNFVSTNLIATQLASTTLSYAWDTNLVPDSTPAFTSTYKIRVQSHDNPIIYGSSATAFIVDNTAPTISAVSIPNVAMKIGDVVTATITVGDDATDTYSLVSGTVGGFALGSLSKTNNTTYTATFTVTQGGTDVAAGSNIPVAGLVLADSASTPNQSATFASSISQGSDPIDANAPTLSAVTIASSNASTTWAKTGDVVTVSFTSNESIGTPTVTIAGQGAVEVGGPTAWTATYTMQAGDTAGTVPFTINFSDIATNPGIQVTTVTSGPSVTFDKTNPSIAFTQDVEAGPVASDTVNLTVTETNGNTATYFYGFSSNVTCDGLDTYGVAYTSGTPFTLNTETNNTKYICAKAVDNAGNIGYSFASTNDLNIDVTPPVISSISMPTGIYNIGDSFTVTITADAAGYTKGTIVVNGVTLAGALTDVGAGSYTISYTVIEGNIDVLAAGVPTASVTLKDSVLNENTAFTTVTESGGAVVIDANRPILSSVTIASNNASTTWAKTGDTITLSFTSNESIGTPTVTIDGQSATPAGGPAAWTATYVMQVTDIEGVVPFTINFADIATNPGVPVTVLTSGPSVAFDRTAPNTPSITSIAGDNYINNSEKSAVHVVGTAEANSAVSVTLTGGVSVGPITGSAGGAGDFDITLDATTLTDGTVTPSVTATDAAGNTSAADTTPTATKDVIAPTVSSITTKDANTNGTVDTATIVFSEAMKDSTFFSAGAFSIDGFVATTFTSGTADDNTVDVSHGGVGVVGTNVKNVLYTPGTVTDLAGNPLAAVNASTVSEVDGAKPVLLSARTIDTTHIHATFSEDLNGATVNVGGGEFTVAAGSYVVSAAVEHASDDGRVILTVATMPTDATPTVKYQQVDSLQDSSGNTAVTPTTVTAVDGVAPTLSPIHIASNNTTTTLAKSGDVVTLTFTSSEAVSAPVVTIDGQSASVSGGTTVWTATYTMTVTDTEGTIPFTINFSDLSSPTPNAGTQVTAVTDASSVLYDHTSPSVNAGTDKEVNAVVSQDATTSDAGSGLASHLWTKQSGPGTITFGTPTAVDTTISASADGTYVIRLTVADNAGNSAYDEITFIWDTTNPEPLTASPSDGSTGIAVASGTATVTYDEPIVLLDATRVLFVNDATSASYKGTVVVSGLSPTVLNVPYSGLEYGTKYRINVKPNALEDVAGNNLATNFISYFTTTIDTIVPVINSLSAGSITTTGATLSATTDESATCKYATTDSAYSSMTAFDGPNTGTSHTATITGLTPATGHDYYVRCADTSTQTNTMTTSAFVSFNTLTPDTTAPVISNIQASTTMQTVATITWTTDESATDRVEYGTTSSYGSLTAVDGTANNTSHSVTLTGLTAGTTYHFRVLSSDGIPNAGTSVDGTFATSAADPDTATPPVPSITTGTAIVNADAYQISGTAGADTPVPSVRTISVYNGATLAGTAVVPIGQTGWSVSVTLPQNATSTFTAYSADASGNVSASSASVAIGENDTIGSDGTAPAIPAITPAGPITVDADTYEINGTVTDDGGVRTVSLFESGSVIGTSVLPAGQTAWAVTVTLNQNVANVITAMATDEAGNTSSPSAALTITEATAADTTAPVISNIQSPSITTSAATITWNTDEVATSLVEYGLTSAYGATSAVDLTLVTSHSVGLVGLSAGTEYHYRVISADALSNTATSTDNTVTTASASDTTAPAVPVFTTAPATIDANTYTLAGTDVDDGGTRTVAIYNGATLAGTVTVPAGQISWSFLAALTQSAANVFTATAADVTGSVSATSTSVTITEATATGDTTPPATPVISTTPVTVDADTYTVTGTAGADLPSDGTRTITIYRGATVVGSISLPAGTTEWSFIAPLLQSTTNSFTAYSTDAANNSSAASTAVAIIEAAGAATLAVTGVDTVANQNGSTGFAIADNTFDNGWRWTFHVTVPAGEINFSMKFSDLVSGANVLGAATNIRYYTAQSSTNSASTTAVTIAGANTYPAAIVLDGDASAGTAGRQIDVTVEARVPVSTSGGSYSTSYGVSSGGSI